MQLALSSRTPEAESRRSRARARILLDGFWRSPTARPPARVLTLHPAVDRRRAPSL